MVELSQEEHDRIYAEEKARREARHQLQKEANQINWTAPIPGKTILRDVLLALAFLAAVSIWLAYNYGG